MIQIWRIVLFIDIFIYSICTSLLSYYVFTIHNHNNSNYCFSLSYQLHLVLLYNTIPLPHSPSPSLSKNIYYSSGLQILCLLRIVKTGIMASLLLNNLAINRIFGKRTKEKNSIIIICLFLVII